MMYKEYTFSYDKKFIFSKDSAQAVFDDSYINTCLEKFAAEYKRIRFLPLTFAIFSIAVLAVIIIFSLKLPFYNVLPLTGIILPLCFFGFVESRNRRLSSMKDLAKTLSNQKISWDAEKDGKTVEGKPKWTWKRRIILLLRINSIAWPSQAGSHTIQIQY